MEVNPNAHARLVEAKARRESSKKRIFREDGTFDHRAFIEMKNATNDLVRLYRMEVPL